MKNNLIYKIFFVILFFLILTITFIDNIFLKNVFIQILISAGYGMSWNLMAGLSGQLSFGHILYGGIASYLTAYSLTYYHEYLWFFIPAILLLNAGLAGGISFLTTRFRIEHAYFTLMTISFLECGRMFFENIPWFGGSAGFFSKPSCFSTYIYENFLWVLYGVTLIIFILTVIIFHSKLGRRCLALKENRNAAQSIGINPFKSPSYMMMISASLAALVGITFSFYQKTLFPDDIFSMAHSMHLILAPLIGGVGHVFGPLIGAFIIIPMGELIDFILEDLFNIEIAGVKQIIFGTILLCVVLIQPKGIMGYLKKR